MPSDDLPALDLRSNLGTWAVPLFAPAVAHLLTQSLPAEQFDPGFLGQELRTTYFDTPDFRLRRARRRGTRYLTLRIRCYGAGYTYALSAKTEAVKYRVPLRPETAEQLLQGNINSRIRRFLPADLVARLLELAAEQPLVPVTTIGFQRYAVEDDTDRLTLDIGIRTDAGKYMPVNILEFKSKLEGAEPPPRLGLLQLRPIKMSKFLWATQM